MSRTENSIVIDRAVEDVWSFLSDPQNLPAWCPEADHITQLSDGPFARGMTLMVSGRIGPLRFRSTQQVTVFESHRGIELRSVDGLVGGSLLTRVDLKPAGARTTLTGTSDVQGLPRWLAVLDPGRRRDREAVFARLKRSLEAQAQPATAPAAQHTPAEPSLARTEPQPLRPDPEPLAESQPAASHPSAAAHPVNLVIGVDAPLVEAEAPATQVEEPTTQAAEEITTQAEAPTPQAESPTPQAESPTPQAESPTPQVEEPITLVEEPATEKDGPAVVSGSIAADDPGLAVPSEADGVDVAPARGPMRRPRATADERVGIPHAPPVDEVRLVLRLETERVPSPSFEITRSGATIGRAPENTVRLDDLSVSRRHARITYRQGGYWLSDLKSASGTWVDETKLSAPRRLAKGQSIRIGILRLSAMFVAAGDELPTSSDVPAPPSELAGRGRGRH